MRKNPYRYDSTKKNKQKKNIEIVFLDEFIDDFNIISSPFDTIVPPLPIDITITNLHLKEHFFVHKKVEINRITN